MKIWKTKVDLETLNAMGKNTMFEHIGIVFVEIGEDYLLATMPVDSRTTQPAGIMHGGASCALAETIGSVAANLCIDVSQQYCVGLDINTSHIKMIKEGIVWGFAKPIHLGKSTQIWEVKITNESKQLISLTRLTMAVLSRQQ